MTINETLKTKGGICLTFMDCHMAWKDEQWTVWRNLEEGPVTLIETPNEDIAISVLMGFTRAL